MATIRFRAKPHSFYHRIFLTEVTTAANRTVNSLLLELKSPVESNSKGIKMPTDRYTIAGISLQKIRKSLFLQDFTRKIPGLAASVIMTLALSGSAHADSAVTDDVYAEPEITVRTSDELKDTRYSAETVQKHRGIKILLDPGHDHVQPGVLSSEHATGEYVFNVNLAVKLQQELNRRGYTADLTHTLNETCPLTNRTTKINGHRIFVSLHHDSVQEFDCEWTSKKTCRTDSASGYSVLLSNENPMLRKTYILAYATASYLKDRGFSPNYYHHTVEKVPLVTDILPVYDKQNLYVLRNSSVPAVLVETAVITNPADEKKALDEGFQKKFTEALADGIDAYFELFPENKSGNGLKEK